MAIVLIIRLSAIVGCACVGGYVGLNGLDLTARTGRRLALIGASGVGTTMFLRRLDGTLKPQCEAIQTGQQLASDNRRHLAAWPQVIGLVFHNPEDQISVSTVFRESFFEPRILATQDVRLVYAWADEVGVMRQGRVVCQGAVGVLPLCPG